MNLRHPTRQSWLSVSPTRWRPGDLRNPSTIPRSNLLVLHSAEWTLGCSQGGICLRLQVDTKVFHSICNAPDYQDTYRREIAGQRMTGRNPPTRRSGTNRVSVDNHDEHLQSYLFHVEPHQLLTSILRNYWLRDAFRAFVSLDEDILEMHIFVDNFWTVYLFSFCHVLATFA
jgi:hypothetical protein